MTTKETPKPRRRVLWRWVLAALVAAAAIGAVLATGYPQQQAAYRLITQVTGGPVIIDGIHLGTKTVVDRVALFDDEPSLAQSAPALELDTLSVTVNWNQVFENSPRYFDEVRIAHVGLRYESQPTGETTYDFPFLTPSEEPSEPLSIRPYLPRTVDVSDIDISYRAPAMDVVLNDLAASATLSDLANWDLVVQGKSIGGEYRVTEPPMARSFTDGTIDIRASAEDRDVNIRSLSVDLPGFARIAGHGDLRFPPLQIVATFALENAWLGAMALEQSLLIPVPITFESIDASGSTLGLSGGLGAISFTGTNGQVAVSKLRLGNADTPYFVGDANIELVNNESGLDIRLGLNDAPAIETTVVGVFPKLTIEGKTSPWTIAKMLEAFPWLNTLVGDLLNPTLAIGGEGRFGYNAAGIDADVALQARAGDARLAIALNDLYIDTQSKAIQTGFQLRSGEGEASGTLDLDQSMAGTLTAHLKNFEPGPLAPMLLSPPFADQWPTQVSGDVVILSSDENANMQLDVEADALPFLPGLDTPVQLASNLVIDATQGTITSKEVQITSGDRLSLIATNPAIAMAPFTIQSGLTARADITALLPDAGIQGNVEFEGATSADDSAFSLSGTANMRALGFMGMNFSAVPVRAPLKIAMPMNGSTVRVALGEIAASTLRVAVEPFDVNLDSIRVDTAATVSGGLDALADLGYLQRAEGTLAAHATISVGEEEMNVVLDSATIEGTLIELLDDLARVSGVAVEVDGTVGDATAISGDYALARAEAVGLIVRDLRGGLRFNGTTCGLSIDEGKVFGGRLHRGSASITLGEEIGFSVDTQIRDADLAIFTEEFQPPDTKLTGIVSGFIRATAVGDEITKAEVMLRAPNGFSINKNILRAPLAAQAEGNAALRVLLETWESTNVESEQRHFDAATIRASLEEGGQFIKGEANFISDDLRIALPLRIDTRVITRALSDQHQRLFENLDGIRLSPPEL